MGGPLGALENISEIEKLPSWRRRQLVPGLVALGFGLFLLQVSCVLFFTKTHFAPGKGATDLLEHSTSLIPIALGLLVFFTADAIVAGMEKRMQMSETAKTGMRWRRG
jgi:polyferredoxin